MKMRIEESREYMKYLDEALYEYSQTDFILFTCPDTSGIFLPDTMKNFYDIDITEITDFDNLHHAEGILKENQQLAASLYGADFTYFLINGSTAGIFGSSFSLHEEKREAFDGQKLS